MNARAVAASLLLCLYSPAALAADPLSGDAMLADFARCKGMADPAERLACLEAATGRIETAIRGKEVRIVGKQEVRKARRSLFGFTIPRVGLFGDDDRGAPQQVDVEEFKQLDTTIVSARAIANSRVELRLAEGDAVWVTTDPMPFPPKPGRKVRIRQGALGNYFIAVEGERSVRGLRLR